MTDGIWALLRVVSDGLDEMAQAAREEKERRYNSPEAKAKRSERSRKAAATVRARREAEEQLEAERQARVTKGPVCGAFGVILQAQETECIRPPHKHGDHEDIDGNSWPSYEGEYDEMLKVTTGDLRKLLASQAEQPVLYVACDEETGEPVRLEVGAELGAHRDDIVVRQRELKDVVGAVDDDEELEGLLEEYQAKVTELEEAYAPDDACVAEGTVYPEHDFPPQDEGNECRRCGAEADYPEPDGVYNGETR